jgi:hypothetical protein
MAQEATSQMQILVYQCICTWTERSRNLRQEFDDDEKHCRSDRPEKESLMNILTGGIHDITQTKADR